MAMAITGPTTGERRPGRPSATGRILVLLLLSILAAVNSAIFYFVIWDLFADPSSVSVALFVLSGGAHFIYFFLPWLARELLGPVFRMGRDDPARYGGAKQSRYSSAAPLLGQCLCIGAALCVLAVLTWAMQEQWDLAFGEPEPALALVTEANCLQIGGKVELRGGALYCALPKAAE